MTGNYVLKSALAVLDVIASNHWTRPVYFNFTSLNNAGLELTQHVVQEGNLYRLAPINHQGDDVLVDTQRSYENLIEKADYTNLQNGSLNFNYEDYQSRIITPVRMSMNSLAIAYLQEGNDVMAAKVMDFALEKLYAPHLRSSLVNLQTAEILRALERDEAAKKIYQAIFDFHYDQFQASLRDGRQASNESAYLMRQSARLLADLGETQYVAMLNNIDSRFKNP